MKSEDNFSKSILGACLRGSHQRFDHRTENHQPICGIQSGFHSPFRVRHQSGNVALAIANAGDILKGAVGITGGVILTVSAGVAKNDLLVSSVIPRGSADQQCNFHRYVR